MFAKALKTALVLALFSSLSGCWPFFPPFGGPGGGGGGHMGGGGGHGGPGFEAHR